MWDLLTDDAAVELFIESMEYRLAHDKTLTDRQIADLNQEIEICKSQLRA